MEYGLEPFVLRHNPDRQQWLHVRLAPGDPGVAMASLESIWKKYDHVHSFKGEFMDETVRKSHNNATFVSSIAGIFGILSLSIACMGLLGMVTYTVSSRVKEIGVRKVLGASTLQITLTLARFFLILLGISVAIAIPLGLKISNLLLSLFVYRIDIGWGILGSSTAILLLLGLLTIGVQTLRAARTNPVDSLRSE
jgi:putative ABC transport system permease protein